MESVMHSLRGARGSLRTARKRGAPGRLDLSRSISPILMLASGGSPVIYDTGSPP